MSMTTTPQQDRYFLLCVRFRRFLTMDRLAGLKVPLLKTVASRVLEPGQCRPQNKAGCLGTILAYLNGADGDAGHLRIANVLRLVRETTGKDWEHLLKSDPKVAGWTEDHARRAAHPMPPLSVTLSTAQVGTVRRALEFYREKGDSPIPETYDLDLLIDFLGAEQKVGTGFIEHQPERVRMTFTKG